MTRKQPNRPPPPGVRPPPPPNPPPAPVPMIDQLKQFIEDRDRLNQSRLKKAVIGSLISILIKEPDERR